MTIMQVLRTVVMTTKQYRKLCVADGKRQDRSWTLTAIDEVMKYGSGKWDAVRE